MTMYDILARLERHYAGRMDVHFGINSFIYYVDGNARVRVAPDVYAVFGVRPRPRSERRSYRLWEEGVPPAIVFEITSPGTRNEDLARKREIYAGMGVREYVLFDPLDEYLRPRLRGFVLRNGSYVEQPPGDDGGIVSDVLGVRLVPAGEMLRFIDLETGEHWLTGEEEERQRAEAEAQRAAQQEERAEAEARQRQAEAERADRAEAELRALRAQLEARRGNGHGTNGAPNT